MRVTLPEEELLARRRIERLVADAGLSDPMELDDAQLADAVGLLADEEREVSDRRTEVLREPGHVPGRAETALQRGPQPGPELRGSLTAGDIPQVCGEPPVSRYPSP